MSAGRLAELPEAAATGSVAELYEDIRAVLGLPMVNLVYRHLATKPGLLEQCWAGLRPNLASRAAAAAADELVVLASLPGVPVLPGESLAVAGLAGERACLARATLAAYRRANSLNVLGMFALLDGCSGSPGATGEAVSPPPAGILPMALLEDIAPPVAALLDQISLHTIGAEEPRLVPSLLRHFAGEPCMLALVWTALRPATAEVARRGEDVAIRARALAQALPHPVPALQGEGERAVAARFSRAIARTLVLGEGLSAALAEAA
jgi:hypothetical protein